MTAYYQKLLGKQMISRENIDKEVMQEGHMLQIEQQLQLIAPFSKRDIKEAMFSLHPVKSPSPDGYSSSVSKQHGQR